MALLEARMRPKTLTNTLNPGRAAPYQRRVFIGEYGWPTGPGERMTVEAVGE